MDELLCPYCDRKPQKVFGHTWVDGLIEHFDIRMCDGDNGADHAPISMQGITFHKGRGWWSIKVEVRG